MIIPSYPGNIDVLVLCGGKGLRLQSVINDRPKPMADINSRPFLDILIEYVSGYGFKRFILCTGYMKENIKHYFKNKQNSEEIIFSEEKTLLGTGGAIKNAEFLIKRNLFLIMNGDSYCPLNLNKFLNFHIARQAELSLCLVKADNSKDYGAVNLDNSNRIIAFNEKKNKKNAFVSAGIYLFNQSVLSLIPSDIVYSLENDLFPKVTNNKCYGYVTKVKFIDIGTPERYKEAVKLIK